MKLLLLGILILSSTILHAKSISDDSCELAVLENRAGTLKNDVLHELQKKGYYPYVGADSNTKLYLGWSIHCRSKKNVFGKYKSNCSGSVVLKKETESGREILLSRAEDKSDVNFDKLVKKLPNCRVR